MNAFYISMRKESTITQVLSGYFKKVKTLESLESFIHDSNNGVSSIVISMEFEKVNIENFVGKLRKSDKNFIFPVFFENNGTFIFYETPVTIIELVELSKKVESLYHEIEHHNYNSWENRILSYFYTRPNFTIAPKLNKCHKMFYSFPLVEQFHEGQEDYFYWLEEMSSQNILSKIKLIDRMFCCPYCFSALLKFSDHCPNCNSINIINEKFIHCFTCGCVAPESLFLKNERFVCPSCKSKLKLIGQDYDRPLENGVCSDCGNYHIDSKLEVTCLNCNRSFTTEDLTKKLIYEYNLTEYGRNQVKFGTIDIDALIISKLNYLELNYFTYTLDWFIQMQTRFKEETFSLIAMKVIIKDNQRNFDLLLEFSELIRNIFRNIDHCSKLNNTSFLFLFPKTDLAKLVITQKRIEEFIKSIEVNRYKFEIKMKFFTSTQANIAEVTGRQLIQKIANKL